MAMLGHWFGFGREELFDQAMRAYDRGDWEGAAERFEACIEGAEPSMSRLARFYLGESYAQFGRAMAARGNYESAAANLARALQISPRYPDLHVAMARVFGHLDDNESRAAEIEKALEINPNFVDAQYERGLLEFDLGRTEEGIAMMRRAIDGDPTLDLGVFDKGLAAYEGGDLAVARSYFACATASDSGVGRIHFSLAANFHRERMFEEAADQYRVAIEHMPRYADVHCRYGQVLLELGHLYEAVAALRKAAEINPRYVQAHAYLAIALLRTRQNEQAKAEVEVALNLDPGNPVALSAARRLTAA